MDQLFGFPESVAAPAWDGQRLLGFDTETTGVNPSSSRLVTAALVDQRAPGDETTRTWLADPGVPIPQQAQDVHGISTAYAQAHGRPVADVVDEVAAHIAQAAQEGVPLVIFNANYDLPLLEAEAARHQVAGVGQRLGSCPLYVLDPLVLDRALDRYRRGKRTLGALCAHYQVNVAGDLHDALTDVRSTLGVLRVLLAAHPQLAAAGLAKLHQYQADAHRSWARNFNKWLQSQGRTPDACESWPLGR